MVLAGEVQLHYDIKIASERPFPAPSCEPPHTSGDKGKRDKGVPFADAAKLIRALPCLERCNIAAFGKRFEKLKQQHPNKNIKSSFSKWF